VFIPKKKTPSEILLPQILCDTGHKFKWDYVEGVVEYPSIDKALEVTMNFHLKGFFNDKPELPVVYTLVRSNLENFEKEGKIKMRAGYIHIEKNEISPRT
jgi:hypothetical protein